MSRWRLLLTRPEEDCAALAATLAEHGIHGDCLPLLAITPREETPAERSLILDLDRYCAVIVVSKPAARLGLERVDRYWPQPPLTQRWFTVGAATAAILEDYGLDVVCPQEGDDSEALLALPAFEQALQVLANRVRVQLGRLAQFGDRALSALLQNVEDLDARVAGDRAVAGAGHVFIVHVLG